MNNIKLHEGCPTNTGLTAPLPDLVAMAPKITLGTNSAKASIKDDGSILVDATYWNNLTPEGRRALLFHELAHLQRTGCAHNCDGKPAGCERCADNRMGAMLYLDGFSHDDALKTAKSLNIRTRKTTVNDMSAGFMAAQGLTARNAEIRGSVKAVPLPGSGKEPSRGEGDNIRPGASRTPVAIGVVVGDGCPDFEWIVGIVGLATATSIIAALWINDG